MSKHHKKISSDEVVGLIELFDENGLLEIIELVDEVEGKVQFCLPLPDHIGRYLKQFVPPMPADNSDKA